MHRDLVTVWLYLVCIMFVLAANGPDLIVLFGKEVFILYLYSKLIFKGCNRVADGTITTEKFDVSLFVVGMLWQG